MLYSPTVTAIIGLNGAADSALFQLTQVKDPIKKASLERQEAQIMSCFLELLAALSDEDRQQVLAMITVDVK
ncbi:hypothetical protein [Thalassomonas haliotis]|uniref:Uncharacterized protein n=1 Tax=Thalassomonas haliotis TaxID=485448 RepID=A0ABY7VI55_9GAMM|nr:hypothetical protein [Thalassomonas haliotis]WDE12342.1 hypothetical protein H3N35_02320 [Thalassomonas haliotis]